MKNGIKIHYQSEGEGDAIILLTGFGSDMTFWKNTIPFLSKDYKVVTIDNRGSGSTEYIEKFTMKDLSEDVISIMDQLSIHSAHVLAWSMGTHIALNIAAYYPERIKTLTLVSSYRYRPARSNYVLYSAVEALKNGAKFEYFNNILNGFCLTEDFFKRMEKSNSEIQVSSTYNLEGLEHQMRAVEESNVSELAKRIKSPTLSIHGTADIMVECSEGDELAKLIEDCKILRIEGAGHRISSRLYINELKEHLKSYNP